jgi:hypothetical protein
LPSGGHLQSDPLQHPREPRGIRRIQLERQMQHLVLGGSELSRISPAARLTPSSRCSANARRPMVHSSTMANARMALSRMLIEVTMRDTPCSLLASELAAILAK